jgi:hypothetical protein
MHRQLTGNTGGIVGDDRRHVMKLPLLFDQALVASERDRLLMALAALISFESWDQLRHSDSLSIAAAQAVWRSAIDRLLPRDDVLLEGATGSSFAQREDR